MHWITIAAEGQALGYLAEPLGKYRWRTDSLMSNQSPFVGGLCQNMQHARRHQRPERRYPLAGFEVIIIGRFWVITEEECKRRIKRFRKLQKEIDALLAEALANAPWISKP